MTETGQVPPQVQGFDGSDLKKFVEDPKAFDKYVDKTFKSLDVDHKGTLRQKELTPIMGSVGQALGLPPIGTDAESDHIYEEVFAEFGDPKGVTKETFAKVLQVVFLGLADGLERDPIQILPIDGSKLREYVGTGTCDSDAVATFARLDVKQENALPATKLLDALKGVSVEKGMPPAADPKMKNMIGSALASANINTDDRLDQFQFVDDVKKVMLSIADGMEKTPVDVAHSAKVFDGKGIVAFLKDKSTFQTALDEAWQKMPKDKKGRASRDYLRVGVDELCPAAGLPPLGAVDEVDDVMKTVFSTVDLDHGGTVTKEEFDKTMLEVLGSMMLQLDGKPIAISNSTIVDVDNNSTILENSSAP